MDILQKIKHMSKEYAIRILTFEDEDIIQSLCEKCTDYYEIVEGGLPAKDTGYEILHELPPDKDYEDKLVLGCFNEEGELITVIDIVKDFPDKGEWIIGLLMINPTARGNGLGKALHEFIKDYAFKQGANKLRIGVVQDNVNAYAFWSRLGYYEVKKVNMRLGNKDNVVIVMNLQL